MSAGTFPGSIQPVSCGLRAFFAPVRREDEQITTLRPTTLSDFDLNSPPSPWIDAGWVDGLRRTSETKFGAERRGKRATRAAQYRTQLDSRIEVEFRQWGKVQMALSGGSEHFNILATGSNGLADVSVPILPGSTATEIRMNVAGLAKFEVGDLVAADVEYVQQTGYIGTGVSGSFVAPTDVLPMDPDYVRRVTFNVERVASKTETSLILDRALAGGAPLAGASAQKVVGFSDREGGRFLQEWSALFVLPEITGGQIFLYYPRLQPTTGADETDLELAAGLKLNSLKASFVALPYVDPLDGEPVLCYRNYIPMNVAGQ
jgi:hypothetical protein